MSGRYKLLLSGAARRTLERELPMAIALAVWEFCDGPLRENPRRVGKPLGRELAGYFSARRGAYRAIYRLIEDDSVIHVVRIEHRADVYRRRWSWANGDGQAWQDVLARVHARAAALEYSSQPLAQW